MSLWGRIIILTHSTSKMKCSHVEDRHHSLQTITSALPKCREPFKVNAQHTGEKPKVKAAPGTASQ